MKQEDEKLREPGNRKKMKGATCYVRSSSELGFILTNSKNPDLSKGSECVVPTLEANFWHPPRITKLGTLGVDASNLCLIRPPRDSEAS